MCQKKKKGKEKEVRSKKKEKKERSKEKGEDLTATQRKKRKERDLWECVSPLRSLWLCETRKKKPFPTPLPNGRELRYPNIGMTSEVSNKY